MLKTLKKDELVKVKGGISAAALTLIGLGIVFLIGLIEGLVRPLRCR